MKINSLIDFFIPNICYICGKPLKKNEHFICNNCIRSIPLAEIGDCLNRSFSLEIKYFNNIFYYTTYDGTIKESIHLLKYASRKELSLPLAELLLHRIVEMELLLYSYDYIVFIPMHRVKMRERGFNQSEEIAKQLSRLTQIPLLKGALVRSHNGISQTKLSIKSRLSNVIDNFKEGKEIYKIKGKNVVLIDDVITTGSTLNEASKVLSRYKPKNIDCLTLASAKK